MRLRRVRGRGLSETVIDGHIPVSLSGGPQSNGHPIVATGLGQVFELLSQQPGD